MSKCKHEGSMKPMPIVREFKNPAVDMLGNIIADGGWQCVHCGMVAPKCFQPVPEAVHIGWLN